MAFSEEELKHIYERTSGYCHICHKKLAFMNYGKTGTRAAWEVEHSNPRAKGGSNGLNNLYPACISCNRSKGASSTTSARANNGKSRSPLSVEKRRKAKAGNALAGGTLGAMVGGAMAGPVGAFFGACVGATFGHKQNPDK